MYICRAIDIKRRLNEGVALPAALYVAETWEYESAEEI